VSKTKLVKNSWVSMSKKKKISSVFKSFGKKNKKATDIDRLAEELDETAKPVEGLKELSSSSSETFSDSDKSAMENIYEAINEALGIQDDPEIFFAQNGQIIKTHLKTASPEDAAAWAKFIYPPLTPEFKKLMASDVTKRSELYYTVYQGVSIYTVLARPIVAGPIEPAKYKDKLN